MLFAGSAFAVSDAESGENITACFYPSARFTKATFGQSTITPSTIVTMPGVIEFIDPLSNEEQSMSFEMALFSTLSGGVQYMVFPDQYEASVAPDASCAMGLYWQQINTLTADD